MLQLPDLPELYELLSLWQRVAGLRSMPAWAAIKAEDLERWGPNLIVLEVIGEGEDFLFHRHGRILAARIGIDMTGRKLSEAPEPARSVAMAEYRAVLANKVPMHNRGVQLDRANLVYDKLILPLSSDQQRIDFLLAAIYPHVKDTQ